MYLENLVFDAVQPRRLGAFWQAVVGGENLTDEPDVYETRLRIEGGPTLDLCFQRVPERPSEPVRLHLDLLGGVEQASEVRRLIALGAQQLDIGQQNVPWVVLADPEGNPCCVMEERSSYVETGPIAALPLDSADPERDKVFWSWLTGWVETGDRRPRSLRHPSYRGPLLELCAEPQPSGEQKNRLHLDLRLEPRDDSAAIHAGILDRGGREVLHPEWGPLPWRCYADPSGNDFCVLPVPPSTPT